MDHKIALLFPGQGSQYVGMGEDFYNQSDKAKGLFEDINGFLGKRISDVCFKGPEDELTRTINTQPAILSVSIVAYEMLKEAVDLNPQFVAGHSLGEYTALYASEVLDLKTVVQLVKRRAELMEDTQNGTMYAVIGMDINVIKSVVEDGNSGVVTIANYNSADQVIISGDIQSAEAVAKKLEELGARKVIKLQVGGAFHSPLMKPAAEKFKEFINTHACFADGQIPVMTNVDGIETTKRDEIKTKLGQQISSSVLWYSSIQYMLSKGIDTFIEIGPGKVLSSLAKKIDRQVSVLNVNDMESLESIVNKLKTVSV